MIDQINVPLYGVRRWVITPGGLAGIFKTKIWEPTVELAGRQWAKASCEAVYVVYWGALPGQVRSYSICGRAPGDACSCGYYGLFGVPRDWRMSGLFSTNQAFGIAEYAGDVILAEEGLRAELARPVYLVVSSEKIEEEDLDRITKMWPGVTIERVGERGQIIDRVERLAKEFLVGPL